MARPVLKGMWEASDEALLAGFALGDAEAGAVFVRRFRNRVFGLALSITRDRVDADEVAQDAFVRAWRYAASYDPRRGTVLRWLLTITRNVALDRVRSTARRPESPTEVLPANLLVDDVDNADLAALHDDAARIVSALRVVPVEQREAIVAVTLGGMSAREYSDASHLPLGTVKTRIRLALRKLRDELGAFAT
ncbi:MAG TPA: sigma-70 family RNA polymerase sigma factor [Acidimicrobiia bacterium]